MSNSETSMEMDYPSSNGWSSSAPQDKKETIKSPPPPAVPTRLPRSSSNFIGGGFVENDSIFRQRFVIPFSEATGKRGTITLETLASMLQEAAANHVMRIDYPFTPGKNLGDNITGLMRMHIEVTRYPTWRDFLEVDTWFHWQRNNAVRRDWIVKDVSSGQTLAVATSVWAVMNIHTKKKNDLTEEQWATLKPYMGHPARDALSAERRLISSKKISKLEGAMKKTTEKADIKDTDMKQQVNPILYMRWMMESIPHQVTSTNEVRKLTMEVEHEAVPGKNIESMIKREEDEFRIDWSHEAQQFVHLLQTMDGEMELGVGRTVWTPLVQ